jgi:tetratricopeptide (TPR) repeat protein
MKKSAWVSLAAILAVLSVCGLVHGIRAALANTLYFQAKYGSEKDNPTAIFALYEQAHWWYPFNYNFCILAAETAYYSSFAVDPKEAARRRLLAARWCDTGLRLDFHKSQLRLLKTRLLATDSLPAAIRYWNDYVDWQYWEPYNHAVLVELYAQAGDFDKALESLALTKGSDSYNDASRKFVEIWDLEKTLKSPSGTPP